MLRLDRQNIFQVNPVLFLVMCLMITNISIGQEIVINEFLARNDTTVSDQDGEFDDWIELFNNSSGTISLQGYFLSDDGEELHMREKPN